MGPASTIRQLRVIFIHIKVKFTPCRIVMAPLRTHCTQLKSTVDERDLGDSTNQALQQPFLNLRRQARTDTFRLPFLLQN